MGHRSPLKRSALAAILCLVFASVESDADPIADFYNGRTVTIVVGSTPGGTYDFYARTVARHLGRHIPGEPAVIVQNLAGAGSYLAAQRVYSIAAQDGLTIGSIGAALPYQSIFDPQAPALDVKRINWLASLSPYHMFMLVRSDVPVHSVKDLAEHETIQATIAPGQANSLIVAVVNEVFGARIRGVAGHKSMNEAMLALQRGEVNGYPSMPAEALQRAFLKPLQERQIRLILQFGPEPLPDYKDIPWAMGLAQNEDDKLLIELATGFLNTGYVYMMGPGVPKERVNAMRKSIMAALNDPVLLADASKQTLNIAPIDGEKIAEMLARAYALPPDVIKRMQRVFAASSK
ncbi:MAG: tripartite tricarboxylate transporter substrate-binding protein [Beijerinckiaceae bacterium]|nr:tripartite tricarboxylate transporter substrate-binding protein [Beijerinckiaceae bacterium]